METIPGNNKRPIGDDPQIESARAGQSPLGDFLKDLSGFASGEEAVTGTPTIAHSEYLHQVSVDVVDGTVPHN